MIKIATLLCVLAVYVHGSAIHTSPRLTLNGEELIVGGRPISISQVPYQVSFRRYGSHMCGGSIISNYHVLTAAHCSVVESNARTLTVGSGSDNLLSTESHQVVRNEYNKQYNRFGIDYDVAVLKVDSPFSVNANRKPIAFVNVNEEPAENEAALVSGWGSTRSGGSLSNKLMAVDVNVINRSVCERAYAKISKVTARMICAGILTGGKDSCQGDSGGSLVSHASGKQIGVVSWGYGCAAPNYPGVYTNLANEEIHDFVIAQMKN